MNLGILAVLKYTNFAIANVNGIAALFTGRHSIARVNLVLPLGISFYTFQTMGYVIDVYRGKAEAEKNIFKMALFTSFFPQLIQGPISRFGELSQTLYAPHRFDFRTVWFGLERVLWGYFKKLVIADRIVVAVNAIVGQPDIYSGFYVFCGMLFYAAELYADFTGGIDITIGIAQMFGIQLAENFERPYFSKNIAEYWRRWHITMGTWFKDYLFYPLSASMPVLSMSTFCRKHFGAAAGRRIPVYFVTLVVWFATGIWHGASWNFVLWGVYFGIIIIIEKLFLGKYLEKAPAFLSHLYAIFLFTFGWVLFDFTDMGQMRDFIVSLFNGGSVGLISHDALVYVLAYLPVLIISIIASTPLVSNLHKKIENRAWCGYADAALVLIALVICTASLVSSGYNPFIYFRF